MSSKQRAYLIESPLYVVCDAPQDDDLEALEKHACDLYKLFILRLAKFEASPAINKEEIENLKILFEEILSFKMLINR